MNYRLFKLKFTTPVHFGTGESAHSVESANLTLCADTLFSAFCHAALKFGAVDRLVSAVKAGELAFSDAFPYRGDRLYIPKPMLVPKRRVGGVEPGNRKALKKLKYLPLDKLDDFIAAMDCGTRFDTEGITASFGQVTAVGKVSLANGESVPYSVAVFRFEEKRTVGGVTVGEDCGLYFILGYKDDSVQNLVRRLLDILGLTGIGGKISAGYGKFVVLEEKILDEKDKSTAKLYELLSSNDAVKYILLTTAMPSDCELDGVLDEAMYQLSRRSGFIFTTAVSNSVKKRTQYFFASGSVFKEKFGGALFDVGENLPHPVYRYSKPLFLGVKP